MSGSLDRWNFGFQNIVHFTPTTRFISQLVTHDDGDQRTKFDWHFSLRQTVFENLVFIIGHDSNHDSDHTLYRICPILCVLSYIPIADAMSITNHPVRTIALLWLTFSTAAIGQSHDNHSAGMSHAQAAAELPTEAGQSAFAAIAEIVVLLEEDPHTDWSKVNIDGLRSHLVDMDRLTLSASVSTKELDSQRIQFQITGEARTLQAIQTMVPTHAQMVRTSTDWDIDVVRESDGVTLTVNPGTTEAFTKLKAFGFFGFMTIGAHHQLHHLQMAKGEGH